MSKIHGSTIFNKLWSCSDWLCSPSYFLLMWGFFQCCMCETGLRVWNRKRWTKCKAKLSLTSVMSERAAQLQVAPFAAKSSILQLVMALNSLTGQWHFDRFCLFNFTRAKPISTESISSKYTASWKLECFVELLMLKLIYSGKPYDSHALWHSRLHKQRMIREKRGADDWNWMFSVEWHCVARLQL